MVQQAALLVGAIARGTDEATAAALEACGAQVGAGQAKAGRAAGGRRTVQKGWL